MESEKIFASILSAFSPILFSYLFKVVENRRQTSVRLQTLDEAQKRISFINAYFQTQSALGEINDLNLLKSKLAAEALAIKAEIESVYNIGINKVTKGLNKIQKLFLTFRPLSGLGWLWHILFYLTLTTTSFALLGMFIDENTNEYTQDALLKNLNDTDLLLGLLVFIALLLLFRWLAIANFKKNIN